MKRLRSLVKCDYLKSSKIVLIALIFVCKQLAGQTHTPITKDINSSIHGYWEYLPADYKTSGKKYPLLVFLHGIGERGNGSQEALPLVLRNGPPKLIHNGTFPASFTVNGKTSSFIVISPQFSSSKTDDAFISTLIDYCVANYRVDLSRIYLTGLSMGGGFAWEYAGAKPENAKRLAALLVIAGAEKPYPNLVENIAESTLPVWATHNNGDRTVNPNFSIDWVTDLNSSSPPVKPTALLSIFQSKAHDSWSRTYDPSWRPNGLNVYEWMLQYSRNASGGTDTPPAKNVNPVAKITGVTNITLPVNTTKLDGSYSTDSDGSVKSYQWKFVSGPSTVTIANSLASGITLNNLVAGTYTFQLTVTDNDGGTSTTQATVTVNKAIVINKIPVAVITGETIKNWPIATALLYGIKSHDSDGVITNYAWKFVSGPSVPTMFYTQTSSVFISKLKSGIYTFQLTVTDNSGATSSSTINIYMYPLPPGVAPVAVVSGNTNITMPVNSTQLDAGKSYSPNGSSISSYQWKYISGPAAGYTMSGNNSQVLKLSSLSQGEYGFQLTIVDGKSLIGMDTVWVVVNPSAIPNKPPVAVITGQTIKNWPVATAILYGNRSYDSDGVVTNYAWKFVSGPSVPTMFYTQTSTVFISKLKSGVYTFQLTVTDNDGAIDTATVDIDMYPLPPGVAPVASVSGNTNITLPVNSTQLDAGNSYSPNGSSISSYQWKYVSGPSNYTLSGDNSQVLKLSNLSQGKYGFQLTIVDGKGLIGVDTVWVVVNPSAIPNKPPVAVITGQTIKDWPVATAILYGNRSYDSDGVVTNYAWKFVSGPSVPTMFYTQTSTVFISKLKSGIYTFQLTVTDNDGATDVTTAKIYMYPLPNNLSDSKTNDVIVNDQPNAVVSGIDKILNTGARYKPGLTIAPVPVKDQLNVIINDTTTGKVLITIVDGSGRVVITKDNLVKAGSLLQDQVNVYMLSPGMYYFKTVVGTKIYLAKFIKE